jgi:hypothetical protein
MGRHGTAARKSGKVRKSAAVSSKPARSRSLEHLKNKKLHGLEFGLTQRNNILIDCWAADRVPREVIIECFEKAGIYPPGASAALVSRGTSSRSSRRVEKMEAGKELTRINNDMTLSTDQRIIQSSKVLENVLELLKYEQIPAEQLCPQKRKNKGRKAKGGKNDSPSISPSRPAYKNVTGNFSPRALRDISDSFAAEREEWNRARQFICTVEGCSFGLKGAPSRFSGEGYLRGHMKQKHDVTLAPMDSGAVKELKRLQVAAAGKNRRSLPATAADDSSESVHLTWKRMLPFIMLSTSACLRINLVIFAATRRTSSVSCCSITGSLILIVYLAQSVGKICTHRRFYRWMHQMKHIMLIGST